MRTNIETFNDRRQHAHDKISWHIPAEVRRGRFLDIGCGMGNGVVAALQHNAGMAVGIDISLSTFSHQFDATEFPEICRRYEVDPARALLIEADIFTVNFPAGSFDYAMMMDAIEHVPDPARFIAYASQCLRPGGYFMVDACPLYYSRVGHHLWPWFPAETDPWAHLRPDFEQRIVDKGVDKWSIDQFRALNRVTHDEVRSAFLSAGLEIVQEVRGKSDDGLLKQLAKIEPELDLTGINRDWLFENWILLVGKKTA